MQFCDVSEGKSLYKFIGDFTKGDANSKRAIHRLCNLTRKMKVKSAIVEKYPEEFEDDEIKNDISDLIDVLGGLLERDIYRITFVNKIITSEKDISHLTNRNVLASAVIVNVQLTKISQEEIAKILGGAPSWASYVLKAIVKKPSMQRKVILNNYIHTSRSHTFWIGKSLKEGKKFKVDGTFFCQQNGLTSVCAHANICMIVNNMSDTQNYVSPYQINGILKQKRWFDNDFDISDVDSVLGKLRYKTIYHNYFDDPRLPFNEIIYSYLESQFPSLLFFTTRRKQAHVVTVIGHTLNTDLWKGEARLSYSQLNEFTKKYCVSSDWVDHFIINDDNFGMFLCLPIELLKKVTLPQYDPFFRAYVSLTVVPYEFKIKPKQAETFGIIVLMAVLDYLKDYPKFINEWIKRIVDEKNAERPHIVTRTLLVGKTEYITYLSNSEDSQKNKYTAEEINNITNHLPEHFWLIEITLPDLYTTNKTTIVDVVYACDQDITIDKVVNGKDFESILAGCKLIRMPYMSFIDLTFLKDSDRPAPKVIPTSLYSHIKLFANGMENNDITEW